jgi:hypothetical protein
VFPAVVGCQKFKLDFERTFSKRKCLVSAKFSKKYSRNCLLGAGKNIYIVVCKLPFPTEKTKETVIFFHGFLIHRNPSKEL